MTSDVHSNAGSKQETESEQLEASKWVRAVLSLISSDLTRRTATPASTDHGGGDVAADNRRSEERMPDDPVGTEQPLV